MSSLHVSREHPLAAHRVLLGAIVTTLVAVVVLASRGPVWWQRLYHPLRYEALIAAAARDNSLDPYLIAAVINAESGFDPRRVSRAGAVGLMQIMPSTAREVGRALGRSVRAEDLADPALNIAIGSRHLADLLARYEDTATALAAYNAGAGTVERWMAEEGSRTLGTARYSETRAYVERVLQERERYVRLYPDAFRGPEVR